MKKIVILIFLLMVASVNVIEAQTKFDVKKLEFGGVSFSLSYDLIQNNRSPYTDKIIYSVGYVIGF